MDPLEIGPGRLSFFSSTLFSMFRIHNGHVAFNLSAPRIFCGVLGVKIGCSKFFSSVKNYFWFF